MQKEREPTRRRGLTPSPFQYDYFGRLQKISPITAAQISGFYETLKLCADRQNLAKLLQNADLIPTDGDKTRILELAEIIKEEIN
jgi:hypothetical protein